MRPIECQAKSATRALLLLPIAIAALLWSSQLMAQAPLVCDLPRMARMSGYLGVAGKYFESRGLKEQSERISVASEILRVAVKNKAFAHDRFIAAVQAGAQESMQDINSGSPSAAHKILAMENEAAGLVLACHLSGPDQASTPSLQATPAERAAPGNLERKRALESLQYLARKFGVEGATCSPDYTKLEACPREFRRGPTIRRDECLEHLRQAGYGDPCPALGKLR